MNNNRRKCTLLYAAAALLTVIHFPANASSWYFTLAGNEDTVYFFDSESMEKSKEMITLWVKTVQVRQPDTDGSWATAFRWKMNCSKKTIQTLAWSSYDKTGKFIKSYSNHGAEQPVVPDSTGEAMLKLACTPGFPNDPSGKPYVKLDDNDVFHATRSYEEARKSQIDTAPK